MNGATSLFLLGSEFALKGRDQIVAEEVARALPRVGRVRIALPLEKVLDVPVDDALLEDALDAVHVVLAAVVAVAVAGAVGRRRCRPVTRCGLMCRELQSSTYTHRRLAASFEQGA